MNSFLEILQNNIHQLFAVFSIFMVCTYAISWKNIASKFNHPKENEPPLSNDISAVSVLIPFRDESKRIIPLLNSISQLNQKHRIEFIFIDDHSTDQTTNLIQQHQIYKTQDCKILQLNPSQKGKKNAIELGVNNAKYLVILTTDADCEFQIHSVDVLTDTFLRENANLLIAPVLFKTTGESLIQVYQKIENTALVALGFYQFRMKKPTMANGANLMFSKDLFLKLRPFNNNHHVAGGDDIFTLEAFYRHDPNSVKLITSFEAAVYSPVFNKIYDLWNQRIRWVKKTMAQSTKNTAKSQILMGLFFVIFWGLTAISMVLNYYESVLILWLGKAVADIFSIQLIFSKFNQKISNYQILYSSFFQNFFIPAIGIAHRFQKVRWKNRKL